MSSTHLKNIKKLKQSDLAFYPYEVNQGIVSYGKIKEQYILQIMTQKAIQYISKSRIRTWQLQ
jgi:hypothetical protein